MAPNGVDQIAATQAKLVCSLPAHWIAISHTAMSATAFLSALALGLALHFTKIVQNQWYGSPQEWFPSVSATIGDWFPERNIFQVLIALTSGPRLALIFTTYLLFRRPASSLPGFVAITGLLRTLSCGGWVYITSSDAADPHDVAMILYMVCNIPWMLGTTVLTDGTRHRRAKVARTIVATGFFAMLGPLIYWYIQHKVHRRAGAYSIYALFEWSLIFFDVAFDAVALVDLKRLEIRVVDLGARAEQEVIGTPRAAPRAYLAPPLAGSEMHPPFLVETWLKTLVSYTTEMREFSSSAYMALVFWTNLTALPPMIFYSSVWSMGLSGEEVLLFASLSPALLSIARVRSYVLDHPFIMQLLIFAGNAAYTIDDQGAVRLRVVAGAVGAGCLWWTARWWEARAQPVELRSRVGMFTLGLLLSILLKFANFSLNPFWPIMGDAERQDGRMRTGGLNTFGVVLGAAALLDIAARGCRWPNTTPPVSNKTPRGAAPSHRSPSTLSFLASSVSLGSLIFLIHWLYTDSGTIIAWSWVGYPLRGPTAMPHGIFTILSLVLGAALPLIPSARGLLQAREWLTLACASSWALYATKSWPAFGGGALLGMVALSLLPSFVGAATHHSPGPTFFLAFLTYGVLQLASVWTVAFAFVPAGELLRERTDLVLLMAMSGVAVGFGNLKLGGEESSAGAEKQEEESTTAAARPFVKRLQVSFVAILLFSVIVVWHRRRLEIPTPYHPEDKVVTAAIWTVHFALDGRMWESQRRMAEIIQDAEIDIIGLLESDVQRIVGGNRDITQYISSTLNMYADIGPSPSANTWGCALLSKFPILTSTHHLLPSPHGELAPAIHATLDVYGEMVDVVVAHNGQEEDALDRELQSKELARLMREAWPRPLIYLGYAVTAPHAERPAPYQILVEDGLVSDVDPADLDRWCQYILYRGLHRVGYARLNRGSNPAISDTEIQLAKFTPPFLSLDSTPGHGNSSSTPPTGPTIIDLTAAHRVDESLVPSAHRFPDKFKGHGVRGHYYQVLKDEEGNFAPLYYMSEGEEEARKMQQAKKKVDECVQQ